ANRYPAILMGNANDLPKAQGPFKALLNKPIQVSRLIRSVLSAIKGEEQVSLSPSAHMLNHSLADSNPLQILVAEDNRVNQKLVLRMLEKLGYVADLATNGLEAVEMALQKSYDLILMDVQMPVMDGIMATKTIFQELNKPPTIVAMTANALKEDVDRCREAGMSEHLGKPFRSPELVGLLNKFSKAIL
ncbi:MAG: response regulator, partial [Bacteroidota bacterium]